MKRLGRLPVRWWHPVALVAVLAGVAAIVISAHDGANVTSRRHRASTDAGRVQAPAIVWAVGDGADGSAAARRVAARIAADDPDRVLYLGDVYKDGSAAEFRAGFATVYGRLAARMAPTPGNHDWPAHREGYDPYWRSVTGEATPPWYDFRIGGWHVLSLSSEVAMDHGSEQLRWLRRKLDDGAGGCTLAFWHRPRYSAGKHGDQADVAPLWDAVRGRATLVLNAHDHNLQRLRPDGGTTEIVAGAGGHSRYRLDPSYPRLAFATDRVDGAVRLSLRPGRTGVSFVAADGSVLDRTSLGCATR